MANIRDLKKDINYVLGDIIEAVYIYELANSGTDMKKSEAIIDEAIEIFDDLIPKVSERKVENRAAHLKGVRKELEERANKLVDKLNKL
ncbi:MAG: hypothetical protein KJO49_10520 [Bacteroidia bacterium]|nr:hypothetical protein [Bacteroidia bacterium]MBT8269379.1 hypothetical protein [Bacteroidia bacterium]NNK69427.1 hypothetical protein [Flavobacteriaceae bacterium]NNL79485.1 hypothetical protein [Flavobacteriaceae bacterium]